MNTDFIKLDKVLTGIEKYDFSSFSSSANNRKISQYSWPDISFNMNDFPYNTDTAIIVTSWCGQLGWLKATLTNYRLSGAYIILAYDNSMFIWDNLLSQEYIVTHMPSPLHCLLAHSTVIKHKTYDSDKRTGWFWDVRYAQGIISQFKNIKYVYCTNGDCCIDRPDGIKELPTLLSDCDFMSGQSVEGGTIHTACVFYKIDAFNKIMDYMAERNKHTIIGGSSPECLLRDAVNILQLKEKFVESPKNSKGEVDYYNTINADSTWKKILGFRNLYAESEYCENNRLEPIESKYWDDFMNWTYFRHDQRETICKYYETGDRRYLMMWWDRGSDTDTERKFNPIEYYGNQPIYETKLKEA